MLSRDVLPVDKLSNLLFWNGMNYINIGETIDDVSTISQKKEKFGTVKLLCNPHAQDKQGETNRSNLDRGIIYCSASDKLYLEDTSGKLWGRTSSTDRHYSRSITRLR